MSGRRRSHPKARPCPLCGDLAQITVHFDADWWEAIKAAAERELAEVRAEIAEADKHLRMLSAPAVAHGACSALDNMA